MSRIATVRLIGLALAVALWVTGCGGVSSSAHDGSALAVAVSQHKASSAPVQRPVTTRRVRGASGHIARSAVARNPVRSVSVWLPYWNMPAALDSTLTGADLVGSASPFWYTISGDSRIEEDPGAGESSVVDSLRRHGIRVVPTVTETEGMADFEGTLADPARRSAMIHALLRIARMGDYSGLDLDFEDLAVDHAHDAALADRLAARYPAFVGELCGALHAIARSCTVTVMPRTTEAKVYWRGVLATWVYDYGALARAADRIRIMAYDEHAPGVAAGPIGSYRWVGQVIAYAAVRMPLQRTELALAAYGYDWSASGTSAITSREASRLARRNHTSPRWDRAQAEDTFSYTVNGVRHIVWYEGARAELDRARLARAAGFAGIALWAAGGEEPALWPMLRALYSS